MADGVWYFAYGSNMQRATFCGRRTIHCTEESGLPQAWIDRLRAVPTCEESSQAAAIRPLVDAALRTRRNG